MLRPDGSVSDRSDPAYAHWAHSRGLRVWPLFTNDLDRKTSHEVFTDSALRSALIARVAALALHDGADGVNVDWEDLPTADKDGFSAFVREAAAVWRAAGLVVSVDVSARTDAWQLGDWSESFDRSALGSAADFVVLMAYDEHNRLRPVGSTASLPWVRESVEFLLRDVPASKVVLGVPFYTQDWSSDPKRRMQTVTLAETPAHLRLHHASVRWDQRAGQSVATYVSGGYTHRMWIEDARSLGLKAALVGRYGLAGIAAWRIGFETPGAWLALAKAPPTLTVAATSATLAPTPARAPAQTPAPVAAPVPAPRRANASSRLPLTASAAGALGGVAIAAVAAALARRRRVTRG
jgi:spore germination protein YaaH